MSKLLKYMEDGFDEKSTFFSYLTGFDMPDFYASRMDEFLAEAVYEVIQRDPKVFKKRLREIKVPELFVDAVHAAKKLPWMDDELFVACTVTWTHRCMNASGGGFITYAQNFIRKVETELQVESQINDLMSDLPRSTDQIHNDKMAAYIKLAEALSQHRKEILV